MTLQWALSDFNSPNASVVHPYLLHTWGGKNNTISCQYDIFQYNITTNCTLKNDHKGESALFCHTPIDTDTHTFTNIWFIAELLSWIAFHHTGTANKLMSVHSHLIWKYRVNMGILSRWWTSNLINQSKSLKVVLIYIFGHLGAVQQAINTALTNCYLID